MTVQLALTNTGPDGYEVHYSESSSPRNGSPGAERAQLGPDQLAESRYMTGVTENERVVV